MPFWNGIILYEDLAWLIIIIMGFCMATAGLAGVTTIIVLWIKIAYQNDYDKLHYKQRKHKHKFKDVEYCKGCGLIREI